MTRIFVFFSAILFCIFHFITCLVAQQEEPQLIIDPQGHSGRLSQIIITKDGNTIITTSQDKTIRFWDVSTGNMVRTIRLQVGEDYNGTITAAALSPDEKYLAVGVVGKVRQLYDYIAIIDMADYSQAGRLMGPDRELDHIRDLCFSPDGKYLASAHGNNILLYRMPVDTGSYKNVKTWILKGHTAAVSSIAFSKDGRKLASASYDYTIGLWDVNRINAGMQPVRLKVLSAHTKEVLKVAYSPDGKYLLSGGLDNNIFLWDVLGNLLKHLAIFDHGIYSLSIYPDGTQAFVMNDQQACILDIPGGKISYLLKNSKLSFNLCGCFMPYEVKGIKSKFLVTTAGKDHALYIINMQTGKIIEQFKGEGAPITAVGFGKNNIVAFSREGEVNDSRSNPKFEHAFDFNSMKLFSSADKFDSSAEFSTSINEYRGKTLKLASYCQLLVSDGRKIRLDDTMSNEIYCYSFTPDGKILAGTRYSINLYSQDGMLITKFKGHLGPVHALAVTRDMRYLASAGADGTVRIWNLQDNSFSIRITGIIQGELADIYKLKTGDIILTINDKTFTSYDEFMSYLEPAGTYNFKIMRNEKPVFINITRRNEKFGFRFEYERRPLITLFTGEDNQWICCTNKGYYACSANGAKYIVWHLNQGYDQCGLDYNADQLFDKFFRPDIIREVFTSRLPDEKVALKLENTFSNINTALNGIPRVRFIIPGMAVNSNIISNVLVHDGTDPDFHVHIEVTDNGGGIDEVYLYQNEKLVEKRKPGNGIVVNSGQKIPFNFQVSLLPGVNSIKAIAFNKERTESIPVEMDVFFKGFQPSANLYVIAVGINNYKNTDYNLKFAVPDADSFVSVISRDANRIFASVNVKVFRNEDATKAILSRQFAELEKKILPQDVFIFYYSGHGAMNEAKPGDTVDYYLVMSDVTQLYGENAILKSKAISSHELNDWSMNIKAQKQIIILDACQSGGATQSFSFRGAAEEKAIAQLARSAGIVVIAASGVEQYAVEYSPLGHGIFTYSILEGLSGKADGINRDNKITAYELKAWVDDQVPELTKRYTGREQYPTGYSKGQDFPLKIINVTGGK